MWSNFFTSILWPGRISQNVFLEQKYCPNNSQLIHEYIYKVVYHSGCNCWIKAGDGLCTHKLSCVVKHGIDRSHPSSEQDENPHELQSKSSFFRQKFPAVKTGFLEKSLADGCWFMFSKAWRRSPLNLHRIQKSEKLSNNTV